MFSTSRGAARKYTQRINIIMISPIFTDKAFGVWILQEFAERAVSESVILARARRILVICLCTWLESARLTKQEAVKGTVRVKLPLSGSVSPPVHSYRHTSFLAEVERPCSSRAPHKLHFESWSMTHFPLQENASGAHGHSTYMVVDLLYLLAETRFFHDPKSS